MPRKRENAYARASRSAGIYSGVTFVTRSSGVTISKNQMAMTGGQVLPFINESAGYKISTGMYANSSGTAGVTKLTKGFFGFATSINFAIGSVSATNVMTGGVSARVGVATGNTSHGSGVSAVYFRTYTGGGAACAKDVSIQYFAIGT